MSQFLINRNNMQDVREMCAFFAKEHKYEIERLDRQRVVLGKKEFKYWREYFHNTRESTKKLATEVKSWLSNVEARYNHIIDAYNMCLHVLYMTNQNCFVALQVDSKDMGMVISHYSCRKQLNSGSVQ